MHLGNGAITPECAVVTLGAAAAGLSLGFEAARRHGQLDPRRLAEAAALGSLIFAAQAVNVPVLPGISAHLVGGALAAVLLGPGLGALTMAAVLLAQALFLNDGGLAALGANVLNMALLPAALVAGAQRFSTAAKLSLGQATALAALSLPLAAALVALEVALFRPRPELIGWSQFALSMIGVHLWAGVWEGAITALLVAALMPAAAPRMLPGSRPAWALGLAVLLALAWPLSSSLPDGYEAAAVASGQSHLLGR